MNFREMNDQRQKLSALSVGRSFCVKDNSVGLWRLAILAAKKDSRDVNYSAKRVRGTDTYTIERTA